MNKRSNSCKFRIQNLYATEVRDECKLLFFRTLEVKASSIHLYYPPALRNFSEKKGKKSFPGATNNCHLGICVVTLLFFLCWYTGLGAAVWYCYKTATTVLASRVRLEVSYNTL